MINICYIIRLKSTHITRYFGLIINNKYLKALLERTESLIYDDCIYVLQPSYTKALTVFGDVYSKFPTIPGQCKYYP